MFEPISCLFTVTRLRGSVISFFIWKIGRECTWLFFLVSKMLNVAAYVYDCYVSQFAAGGIVRLPKYDVTMAKHESNRKPVLAPEDIRIATM